MANSKIKTLWNFESRVKDSREELDYTTKGLRVGRMDIDGSLMVSTEGYSKVEYRLTMGDGSVVKKATFKLVMDYFGGTVESSPGSNVMTVFLNESDRSALGLFNLEVYKEWTDIDPNPEIVQGGWPRTTLYAGTAGLGLDFFFKDGSSVTAMATGGTIIQRLGTWAATDAQLKSFAKLLAKSLKVADAADIASIKASLGIA